MAEKEKEETISSQTKNVDIEVAATGESKEEISLTRQVKYVTEEEWRKFHQTLPFI